jgi:hypothetical protein
MPPRVRVHIPRLVALILAAAFCAGVWALVILGVRRLLA